MLKIGFLIRSWFQVFGFNMAGKVAVVPGSLGAEQALPYEQACHPIIIHSLTCVEGSRQIIEHSLP
jgi:hypothetical protein